MFELNVLKLESFLKFMLGRPEPGTDNGIVILMGVLVATLCFRHLGKLFSLSRCDLFSSFVATMVCLFVVLASPLVLGEFVEEPLHAVVASGLFISAPFLRYFLEGSYKGALSTWFYSMVFCVFSMHITQSGIKGWDIQPSEVQIDILKSPSKPIQKTQQDLNLLTSHTGE